MSDGSASKSRELERFGYYLRYGIKLSDEDAECKFNPYHDEIGRFTSPPGTTVSYGRSPSGQAARSQRRRSVGRSTPALPTGTPTPSRAPSPVAQDTAPARPSAKEFLDESRRAWMGNGGVPNDDRWGEWARRPARSDLFSKKPPKVVDHIRSMEWNLKSSDGDRLMKFTEIEDYVMDKSTEFWARNVVPPYVREHALFVYQSETKPGVFTARIVRGDGATSMGQLSDFTTGRPLPLRQLPQLAGYRLIMVEHTHPVAVLGFPFRAHDAPSNADMYVAAENPGVTFIVNQLEVENGLYSDRKTESIYFGF